jgi:hypothetical protein
LTAQIFSTISQSFAAHHHMAPPLQQLQSTHSRKFYRAVSTASAAAATGFRTPLLRTWVSLVLVQHTKRGAKFH